MAPTQTAPSLAARLKVAEAQAPVTGVNFLGAEPAFSLGDGRVLIGAPGAFREAQAHPGGCVLVAAGDGQRLLTGGDDGRVAAIAADGTVTERARATAWIDALALGPAGSFAFSAGRTVEARDSRGARRMTAHTTVRGIAFLPKGYRLALARYGGVDLWFPNLDTPPDTLDWKGSHHAVTLSPDGRFVVTAMQENALHGFRLVDKAHMRMTGYPGKTHSFAWSADGLWLATSGADAAIVWPFSGKDGPMGKTPRECGLWPARVTAVAFHPKALVLAIGYGDGAVMMVRLTDASEVLVRPTAGAGRAVTGLAFDRSGALLALGTADGVAGLLVIGV